VPEPPLTLLDTHAHLQDERLAPRLGVVLASAAKAGVAQVIAVATTADDSAQVVRIAHAHRGVFASVGIQPNHVAEAKPGDWGRIVETVAMPRVVAVGETGLDRYWDFTPFALQQALFAQHLDLAHERDLPVVIHCRDCERDIIEQLGRLGRPTRGVLHSFTGTIDDARAFLALGLHVSFAGMVTFANRKFDALRAVAAEVPLDRLLVETDSPYLSPHPFRGQTNEPARVVETARVIARERGVGVEELAAATTANARRLFGLDEGDTLDNGAPEAPADQRAV
jgi:TatD DNase family protein